VLPSSGVLPLNEADPQIQFSTSDAANFVSYSFSFDGGATYTVTTDQAAIESVPGGTGSVMFYSISKQDIAEVPQTVSIDWTVTPQTITQPASSPTVVVEPPAQPLIQPTPVPQDDQQGEQPVQPSQTGDLLQGSPQADSAALDSSTVIGGGDSVDSGTADSEKTIPPININITVRQLGDPAAPAVPTSAVDNSTSTTTGSVPNESTAVLVGQVPPLFSAIFGTIWSFLSAVAHLMFI
jgi:hypothetical protein